MIPLQMLLAAMLGWFEREQLDVIAFLREENRALKSNWLDDGYGWTMPNDGGSRCSGGDLDAAFCERW